FFKQKTAYEMATRLEFRRVLFRSSRFGDGYGAVTDGALEAIERVAGLEGVVLDPVYTGKAMAGLIGAAREGRFGAGDTVVFWHKIGRASCRESAMITGVTVSRLQQ